MRVKCVHGYFFFEEESEGELALFKGATGFDLVPQDHYFTFAWLKDAPEYSIKGVSYLGTPATATYAGKPWEVMQANRFVFDFVSDVIMPIASVVGLADFDAAPLYYFSDSLLLPGSRTKTGFKVTGFTGFARADATKFRYTEVNYDENA